MNKVLKNSGHSVAYFMQSGKPTYTFFESVDGKNMVCGYAYSATDAADITNRLSNAHLAGV